MIYLPQASRLAIIALAALLACGAGATHAEDEQHTPCTEDAMLVFDASGSMAGNGWGYGSENPTAVSRLERVQRALSKILPTVTRFRRVGLITYGTGPTTNATSNSSFRRLRTRRAASWRRLGPWCLRGARR
ncbi:MAG: hypothetical protein ACR2GC_06350 [Methyloceanibacter sp.]|uniref:hypothetical protein n=1 Tax=Methyloceanibacter sp. TaxID=1965321 RepID=UPI003D9B4008